MRNIAFPVAIVLCAVLGGCGLPPAVEVASFAVDGVSYLATGKGSTDQALSAVTGDDCRLSNALRGLDVCRTVARRNAVAAALAPSSEDTFAIPPAHTRRTRVTFTESAGMNIAQVADAPAGSGLDGRVDAAGTLHVYMVASDGTREQTALFTVPGYARNPGAFTGVVMGTRFVAPDAFVR